MNPRFRNGTLLMLAGLFLLFIVLLIPDMNLILWLMIFAASIVVTISGMIQLIKYVRES